MWRPALLQRRPEAPNPETGVPPEVPPGGAWKRLPGIQSSIGSMPLTINQEPRRDLSAWRSPALSLAPIGHAIDAGGPSGLILARTDSVGTPPASGRVGGIPAPEAGPLPLVPTVIDSSEPQSEPENNYPDPAGVLPIPAVEPPVRQLQALPARARQANGTETTAPHSLTSLQRMPADRQPADPWPAHPGPAEHGSAADLPILPSRRGAVDGERPAPASTLPLTPPPSAEPDRPPVTQRLILPTADDPVTGSSGEPVEAGPRRIGLGEPLPLEARPRRRGDPVVGGPEPTAAAAPSPTRPVPHSPPANPAIPAPGSTSGPLPLQRVQATLGQGPASDLRSPDGAESPDPVQVLGAEKTDPVGGTTAPVGGTTAPVGGQAGSPPRVGPGDGPPTPIVYRSPSVPANPVPPDPPVPGRAAAPVGSGTDVMPHHPRPAAPRLPTIQRSVSAPASEPPDPPPPAASRRDPVVAPTLPHGPSLRVLDGGHGSDASAVGVGSSLATEPAAPPVGVPHSPAATSPLATRSPARTAAAAGAGSGAPTVQRSMDAGTMPGPALSPPKVGMPTVERAVQRLESPLGTDASGSVARPDPYEQAATELASPPPPVLAPMPLAPPRAPSPAVSGPRPVSGRSAGAVTVQRQGDEPSPPVAAASAPAGQPDDSAVTPSLRNEPVGAAPAPSAAAGAPSPGADQSAHAEGKAGQPSDKEDAELARRLYPRIRTLMVADICADRERVGRFSDVAF